MGEHSDRYLDTETQPFPRSAQARNENLRTPRANIKRAILRRYLHSTSNHVIDAGDDGKDFWQQWLIPQAEAQCRWAAYQDPAPP